MSTARFGSGRGAGGATCWADDTDELHRFAALLGIKRTSFQCAPKATTPHYDLTAFERDRAIRLGAIVCNREEIVIVSRRARAQRRVE